jgi:SnoaL-like domain
METNQELLNKYLIERQLLQIAWFTDHGPHLSIVDFYTEDGSFDRDGEIVKGRESLKLLYEKRPVSLLTRHVISNFMIDFQSSTQASSVSYASVYRFRNNDGTAPIPPVPTSGPESVSEYHDQWVLELNQWKLQSRVLRTILQAK